MPESSVSLATAVKAANYNIVRYNKLMAVTPQLDVTLMNIGYSASLLHATLAKLSSIRLSRAASQVAKKITKSDALLPGEAVVLTPSPTSRLTRLEGSTAAIASTCSEFRMFLRVVCGLPRMYAGALATFSSPPADGVLRLVAFAQIVAIVGFQALESAAFLAMKNVVAMPPERMLRFFKLSARAFGLYVTLEFVRLARAAQLARAKREAAGPAGGEKEDKVARLEEDQKWWEGLVINSAWWPLALHWSHPQGFLGEGAVAIGTLIAGNYGLRRAWQATA